MADKVLGALSLCRKAGKLVMGRDAVFKAAHAGAAKLVLLSRDLARRSREQAQECCAREKVPVRELPYEMQELAHILGKTYGITAVCDAGFARMIRELLAPEDHTVI